MFSLVAPANFRHNLRGRIQGIYYYMENNPFISIVIPCYNEASHLRQSFDEIVKTMAMTPYRYEIIFVDDCSKDNTREVIKEINDNNSFVSYIFHSSNKGRGGAVKSGFATAKGQIGGFLDIDLEVHSRYIPSMILAILEGADISVGFRVYHLAFNFFDLVRHVMSITYRYISRKTLDVHVGDTETGYKFFNLQRVVPIIAASECNGWFWDTEIIVLACRNGYKVCEVPMAFIRRKDKQSTVKPIRDSIDYLKMLVKFRRKINNGELLLPRQTS